MFRHIRSKLIAAFAVPLAILIGVVGLESVSALGQINSVDHQTALASASVAPVGVVQALQREREFGLLSILAAAKDPAPALVGLTPSGGGLNETSAQILQQTDAALTSFRSSVDHAGSQAEQVYSGAFSALSALSAARGHWANAAAATSTNTTNVTNYETLATETYQSYTAMIDALVGATAHVPLLISDPTLRTGVEAMYTSLEKTEADSQVVEDLVVASWETGPARSAQIDTANKDWGADLSWVQRLAALGSGPYQAAINALSQDPIGSSLRSYIGLVKTGVVPPLSSVLDSFSGPAGSTVQLGDSQIAAIVNDRGGTLHKNAIEAALELGVVGAAGTIIGLLLVALVSRSVSKPLIDLARQAETLATETLPAIVKAILEAASSGGEVPKVPRVNVNSRDEVAEMARALEAVNKTAVELATGQATLRRNLAEAFVNLGRRNQNMVTRQLEYISEIELKEADPESLEELFRLDHLATRMRRNAESLLILAGSGPARQWSAPVPAMDVARAASAEVEDYKRLRLHHFDPAMMTGAVTTDLVHILAELVENALTFSPPGSPVDVYGRFLEGGYVIVIVDSGIGMSAEDLGTANRRLVGQGGDSDVPGRYLGHFVAGRLASRHGIAISLQASHSGGLVARVKIPASLIEEPVPDLSAVAEVRSAPPAPAPEPPTPVTPLAFEALSTRSPIAKVASFADAPARVEAPVSQMMPPAIEGRDRAATEPVTTTTTTNAGIASLVEEDLVEEDLVEEDLVEEDLVEEDLVEDHAVAEDVFEQDLVEDDVIEDDAVEDDLFYEDLAEQPVVAQNVVTEPVVAQPVVAEPVVAEPVVAQDLVEDDVFDEGTLSTSTGTGYALEEDYDAKAAPGTSTAGPSYKEDGYLPDWAGQISEPSWDDAEIEPEGTAAQADDASAWGAPASAAAAGQADSTSDQPAPASTATPGKADGPYDWAAPASTATPDAVGPVSSNGSGGQHEPLGAVPVADHSWDPMLPQKTATQPADNPFWASASSGGTSATNTPQASAGAPAQVEPWAAAWDVGPATASVAPAPEAPVAPIAPAAPKAPKGPWADWEISIESFKPAPAPDLGIASPLVTGHSSDARLLSPAPAQTGAATAAAAATAAVAATAASAATAATASAASWDAVPPRQGAPAAGVHTMGPAEQARNTADGLRKLTRRVPGASLPQEDDSLRRATPTSTTRNPLGLTGALSQYLSATANEGRPEKEHNPR